MSARDPQFRTLPLSLALRSGPNLAGSGNGETSMATESGGQLTARPAAGPLAAADFRYRRLGYWGPHRISMLSTVPQQNCQFRLPTWTCFPPSSLDDEVG
jgi:hypothetical protein